MDQEAEHMVSSARATDHAEGCAFIDKRKTVSVEQLARVQVSAADRFSD
jgi:hypothetical protein